MPSLFFPVLKIVKNGLDVLADIKAVWVADRNGRVGDFGGGHGEGRDSHPLRKVVPVGERAADLQIRILAVIFLSANTTVDIFVITFALPRELRPH